MIKAAGRDDRGRVTVILGLSRENCERLLANQPIPIALGELDPKLADVHVFLIAGETEDDVVEDLRALGVTRVREDWPR